MRDRGHRPDVHVAGRRGVALAERVGSNERLARLPIFRAAVEVDDLRAGVARGAAREDAVALAGERVGLTLVGEREFATGEEHEAVTGRIDAANLREAIVKERPPRRRCSPLRALSGMN